MKTKIKMPVLSMILTLFMVSQVFGSDKYTEAMQKNIDAVYAAKTMDEYQQAVNTFERIATAEKSKWEPYYYAAFGYVMMANNETDGAKKDAYLDLALNDVNKAKEIASNESEIVAMEGFVHMIRVTVDPASRGQRYSNMAFQAFGKAVNMNPENPRALAFLAQMQFGTAQFFSQPTTEACGTNEKALEKFATYKSDNPLAPQWGKGMAESMKERCK